MLFGDCRCLRCVVVCCLTCALNCSLFVLRLSSVVRCLLFAALCSVDVSWLLSAVFVSVCVVCRVVCCRVGVLCCSL